MDIQYARQLLEDLASGMDPLTGEILPPDDVCNHPDIVRALHMVLRQLDKTAPPLPRFENAGKPWTKEDDDALCRLFDSGCSIKELSDTFKRSRGAISSRLARLGKVHR